MVNLDNITLGRTGLRVTAGGLGGGGFSRLGIDLGVEHAASIVRAAYDAGVTFFDTAMAYGSEPAVGQGLRGVTRDEYVISTKFTYTDFDGNFATEQDLTTALDASLKRLETDYVDIYHLHAVTAEDYKRATETFVPAMIRAREQGKIRFPGITERFVVDTSHRMLPLALADDFFDVLMVGYNLLNPSATKTVLPQAIDKNVGVLCMFAVRSALHNPTQLRIDLDRIIAAGQGNAELLSGANPLDFLTLPEDAYRFCHHTPGIGVTLTGTKSHEHLAQNLASLSLPPLSADVLARLEAMLGGVDCVSGQ